MATEKKNERKHELKDIQLFEENGQYYLKLKYIIEDEHSVRELEIPKLYIPFNSRAFPYINCVRGRGYTESCSMSVDFRCDLDLFPGKTSETNHVFYTEKIIKEKHKEMTLAEIEKKLGYKIKIVAEE